MLPLIIVIFEGVLLFLALGLRGIGVIIAFGILLLGLHLWANERGATQKLIPVDGEEMAWLLSGIKAMADKAGVKMPGVYLLDDYIPNAYSFGRTIVLSLGLFEVLDEDEILAVAAHELGHIKNGDTRLFPLVTYGRFLMMATTTILIITGNNIIRVLSLLTYLAYELSRGSFMKKREFMADDTALRLLPVPLSLKRALEELKYYEDLRESVKVSALPSIEPKIERESPRRSFVETHPSYEERIMRITTYVMNLNNRIQ
jgi:heat shock protein HtpX